jgi:hypothetical protein
MNKMKKLEDPIKALNIWAKALEDYQELMHCTTNGPTAAIIDKEMAAIAQTIQNEEVEFGKKLLGFLEGEKNEQ